MQRGRPRPILIGWLALSLAGGACASGSPVPTAESPASAAAASDSRSGRASVYACEDFDFSTQTEPEQAHLWLPLRFGHAYLRLPRVPTASGAKYAAGDVMLWTKGQEALLEIDGETFAGCIRDPRRSVWEDAKLRGVDFRAVGNEPGWHLEITRGERMRLVTDYGALEVSVPTPEPVVDPDSSRAIYDGFASSRPLRVVLEAKPCADTMSGERFPTSVVVSLGDEAWRGCGRPLH